MNDRRNVEVALDNEGVFLVYYPATKIVHHQFRRFTHGAEFRAVLEQGLKIFRKHRATKWLSDDRHNGAIKPADGEWALTDWGPRVMAAGWRYWAVVLPEKVVGQMNMRRFVETYSAKGVQVEVFTDPARALEWLEAQPSD